MIALIVDNYNLKKKEKIHLIFTNFQNYILSDHKYKNYLYEKNIFKKKFSILFSEYFFNSWYRNNNGIDIFKNKFSFAKILNKFLFFSLLNDIKNYYAIKQVLKKYNEVIIISTNESLIRVAKYFKNVKIKKKHFNNLNFIPATPERKEYFFFKKNNIRKLVFNLDNFTFIRFKKKKIFLLKDWTSKNSLNNKEDILVSNSSNYFKSFYWNFNLTNKYKFFYKYREDDFLHSYKIFKIFFKRDADIINKLFKDLFRYHYKSNIKFINETIEILSNTFDMYQPKGFILPSNYDWVSILISEICKLKGVKTFVLLDGFYLFSSKIDFPKDENNLKNIFDYHFSYGQFFKKVLRQNGVSKKNIINIKPPFLKINSLKSYKKYDACILAYDPYIFNLNTTWDKQILIELSILKVLQKIDYKNIVLKIKKSSQKKANSQEKSVELYKKMFKKIYNKDLSLNLEIETGDFEKVLKKSSLVIGGLSTSYIESSFYNVPYYIFEPFENGIYGLNTIVSNSYINRKEINLEKNILKKNWKKIKLENLNFSKNLSDINFKKYI